MVKRLLSVAVMVAMTLAASAQSFPQAPAGAVQKQQVLTFTAPMMKAPVKKVKLQSNQKLLGNNTGDALPSGGYSLGSTGTYPAMTLLTSDVLSKFVGGKIVAMRFAVGNSIGASRVFACKLQGGAVGSDVISKDVESTMAGWNDVQLDEPYVIDDDTPLFLGFDFKQLANTYSFYFLDCDSGDGAYIYGAFSTSGTGWYNFSNYGCVAIQAIVESDEFPQKDIVLDDLTVTSYVSNESAMPYTLTLHNFGVADIENYVLNIEIDGNPVTTYSAALKAGEEATIETSFDLPEGLTIGTHTLRVSVATIDGETPTEYTGDDVLTATFYAYPQSAVVERQKYLLEELTSHSCTYCPYGITIVNLMHEKFSDVAAVCIHGNQSRQDPWNNADCDALNTLLGLQGWPYGVLNRIYDYEGGALTRGLGYYPQYHEQVAQMFYEIMQEESMPAFASVNVKADISADGLDITVSGSGSELAKDVLANSTLNVYITEDGIVGQQLNLGTWESNFEHNHVLRDMVTNIQGDAINWTDAQNYENTFHVTPAADWNVDQLKVIAFIALKPTSATNPDRTQMAISNANDTQVAVATGINTIDTTAATNAYYSIDGRQLQAPQRGLNIVRMADGKVTKVMVK